MRAKEWQQTGKDVGYIPLGKPYSDQGPTQGLVHARFILCHLSISLAWELNFFLPKSLWQCLPCCEWPQEKWSSNSTNQSKEQSSTPRMLRAGHRLPATEQLLDQGKHQRQRNSPSPSSASSMTPSLTSRGGTSSGASLGREGSTENKGRLLFITKYILYLLTQLQSAIGKLWWVIISGYLEFNIFNSQF